MSEPNDTKADPDLARDGDDSNEIEMPIQVVGECVKSGRKILADYDSATGSITIRPKWLHLADMIQAEVQESQEWQARNGQGLEPVEIDPDKALAEIDQAEKALAKEEEATPKPDIPGVDLSKVDPNIAALLIAQQQQLNAVLGKLTEQQDKLADEAKASREKGVVAEGRREMELHRERLRSDIEHSRKSGCPLPPNKNPRFGDKTPKYVQWLKSYRPEVYDERYGVVERDKVLTLIGKDGQSMQVTADIARRKTTQSEKIERDASLAPDMDWNA